MKKLTPFLLLCAVLFSSCHTKTEKIAEPIPEPKDTTIISGVYHFHFDNFDFWTLQDKQNTMSASLFPAADKKILAELMPNGEAESAINGFLLRKNGKYILFDSGLGLDRGGALLDKLVMLNIKPEDIDAVCITHCHGDHIGGMLTNGEASFPNAEVYCADKELKGFQGDKNTQDMLKVYGDRVHRFTAGDTLLGFIATIDAPGHTPGHTLYEIGPLLIVGDLLHAAALQSPHPEYCARYDMDQKKAVATRKQVYQYIEDHHKVVAGMHLPYSGVMEDFGKE